MKINHISAVLMLIFIISCSSAPLRFSRIEYNIPDHIKVNVDDLKKALSDVKTDSSSNLHIKITLYSYSSGAETISFSGEKDFKTVRSSGKIKGLLKIMNGKEILQAEFVEGSGDSTEEMLSALAENIKKRLFPECRENN